MNRRVALLLLLAAQTALSAPPGATPLSPPAAPKSLAPHVQATWKAGTATVKVTPQKLLWMAGYAARKKPAEGKVQELFAKALALEDELGNKLVFVTLDLIGVPQLMRRAVAERAEKEFKLPQANLVMNASHTHSGPQLRTTPLTEADKNNPKAKDSWDYTQKLQNDIVGIIGKAEVNPQASTSRVTGNATALDALAFLPTIDILKLSSVASNLPILSSLRPRLATIGTIYVEFSSVATRDKATALLGEVLRDSHQLWKAQTLGGEQEIRGVLIYAEKSALAVKHDN